ncbi:unnamed protein product [Trichogramma brassicae]|uniref:Uncharacterized protein n=1 Tax=Trichogramma brassicae TaxID=86971 RepID=A0A6H5J1X5_9HYME|nr:unnamed protein product [Trichogramma brassicae]
MYQILTMRRLIDDKLCRRRHHHCMTASHPYTLVVQRCQPQHCSNVNATVYLRVLTARRSTSYLRELVTRARRRKKCQFGKRPANTVTLITETSPLLGDSALLLRCCCFTLDTKITCGGRCTRCRRVSVCLTRVMSSASAPVAIQPSPAATLIGFVRYYCGGLCYRRVSAPALQIGLLAVKSEFDEGTRPSVGEFVQVEFDRNY